MLRNLTRKGFRVSAINDIDLAKCSGYSKDIKVGLGVLMMGFGFGIQGSAKRRTSGFVNFVPAVPYHLLPGFACSIHPIRGPPFSRALKYSW